MPSFEFEFEVFCGRCGAGLCDQSDTRHSRNRHTPQVTVEPCKTCMEKEYDQGYDKGYDNGHSEGYSEGVAERLHP